MFVGYIFNVPLTNVQHMCLSSLRKCSTLIVHLDILCLTSLRCFSDYLKIKSFIMSKTCNQILIVCIPYIFDPYAFQTRFTWPRPHFINQWTWLSFRDQINISDTLNNKPTIFSVRSDCKSVYSYVQLASVIWPWSHFHRTVEKVKILCLDLGYFFLTVCNFIWCME